MIYTDEDVYVSILGGCELGGYYSSPFSSDSNPSFKLYHNGEKIKWKCFSTGQGGDSWDLRRLVKKEITNHNVSVKPRHKAQIYFSTKPVELEYWSKYGISRRTLNKANVKSIKELWVNGKKQLIDKYSFVYIFGINSYKIYQPFSKYKWLSRNIDNHIQKLIYPGDKELCVTSSFKDVMVLYELGYSACAPHNENIKLDIGTWTFLDNDSTGRRMSDKYDLPSMFVPEEIYTCPFTQEIKITKDPSDYKLIL